MGKCPGSLGALVSTGSPGCLKMRRATWRFAEHHTWRAFTLFWRAGPGHLQTMSPHHQNDMFPLEWRARSQWLEQTRLWKTRISDEMHVATISECLSRLCADCCIVCSNSFEAGTIVVPILQIRRLRLGQAKRVCTVTFRAEMWTLAAWLQSLCPESLHCVCCHPCTSENSDTEKQRGVPSVT